MAVTPAMQRLMNYSTQSQIGTGQNIFITIFNFSPTDSQTISNAITAGNLCFLSSGSLIIQNRATSIESDINTVMQGNNSGVFHPASGNFIFLNPLERDLTNYNNPNTIIGEGAIFSAMNEVMSNSPLTGKDQNNMTSFGNNSTFYIEPITGRWFLQKSSSGQFSLVYNPMNRKEDINSVVQNGDYSQYRSILPFYCDIINYTDPICYCDGNLNSGVNYCEAVIFGSENATSSFQNSLGESNAEAGETISANCQCYNGVCKQWANSSNNPYAQLRTNSNVCPSTIFTVCDTTLNANNGGSISAQGLKITQACQMNKQTDNNQPTNTNNNNNQPTNNNQPIVKPLTTQTSSNKKKIIIAVVIMIMLILITLLLFLA